MKGEAILRRCIISAAFLFSIPGLQFSPGSQTVSAQSFIPDNPLAPANGNSEANYITRFGTKRHQIHMPWMRKN